MVVITSDHQFLCDRSDHWIPAPPGTEADVLNAFAKIVLAEGLASPAYQTQTLHAALESLDVDKVAESVGVTTGFLRECALLYVTGGRGVRAGTTEYPASTIWHTFASDPDGQSARAAIAAHNLAILCGNIGRPGGGVIAGRYSANFQGVTDMGCTPTILPGGGELADEASRNALAERWSERWNAAAVPQDGFKPLRELPASPGIDVRQLAAAIDDGRVRALYIAAQSHKWSAPIDPELLAALPKLELLVVEDCFESELTRLAHVVLPAAMYLEKDGSFTNLDRTVQRVRFVVDPPGDARSSTAHLGALAARLGYTLGAEHPAAILNEIAMTVPAYAGVSSPRLERGGMQWPVAGFGTEPTVSLSVGDGLMPDQVRIVTD
jgi:predicted molibdopterin-dependent oxidoreductase YjgC